MQGNILYLGMPITLFLISIGSYIFVSIEIKQKRIDLKEIIVWFILNTIFTATVLYVLIVQILQHSGLNHINIFNWIAKNAFGLNFGGQEWIMLMILGFLAFLLLIMMINTVRIQRLHKRIDDMAKETAILKGKVNKTANFDEFTIAQNQKSIREVRQELKEKVKIAKVTKKAKQKLELLTEIDDQKTENDHE